MTTAIGTRLLGLVLAVAVLPPLAAASEPEDPESGTGSPTALEAKRADAMTAWSVDSGGGQSSGGGFALVAAIGQPDAGVVTEGDTVLAGGLWAGEMDLIFIFGDDFESGGTGSWSSVVGGTE